jgi:hypothetical protein
MVVTALCYWKRAKHVGSGRKWLVVACLMLATFPAIPLLLLLLDFPPALVASLLYCKLAGRSGVGWKWMVVSCIVLAVCEAIQNFQCGVFGYYDTKGLYNFYDSLTTCFTLAEITAPLAIGWWWWFLRRKHDEGRLQLAS